MNLPKKAWTGLNSLQVWKCCTLLHHRNYWVIWELHKCHWFQFINRLGYLRRWRSATTIGLWAHSRLGRKNYAMSTFKLQEKQKGLQLSPLRKVIFKPCILYVLHNLVKIRTLFEEKAFPFVALSENIYNLDHSVNDSPAIGRLAVEPLKLFKMDLLVVL